MTDEVTDDELLARLRDADPAATLPADDPDRVARLLEDTMSPETDTLTREPGTPGRGPLTWLVAAAAVLLIGAAGMSTLVGGDDTVTPPSAGEADPTVTTLTLPTGTPARCMVPSARLLSNAAFAVDAEVVAVSGGVATLDASQWYAGEPTDEVEVDAGSADLSALIGAPEFEEGDRYLVAGNGDGDVMVCGFSGPYSDDLAGLYTEAFGG